MRFGLRRCAAACQTDAALIGLALMLGATQAAAASPPDAASAATSQGPNAQTLYKGVVGTLLDAVPLEPAERVTLQRANAVLSSPLTARSVAVALGLANPPLMLLGAVWGLWSASKIQPTLANATTAPPAPRDTSAATSSLTQVRMENSSGVSAVALEIDKLAHAQGVVGIAAPHPKGASANASTSARSGVQAAPLEFVAGYAPISALGSVSGAAMSRTEYTLSCVACFLPALGVPVATLPR
jgi:hypothetical protein